MGMEDQYLLASERTLPCHDACTSMIENVTAQFPKVDETTIQTFKIVMACLPHPVAVISMKSGKAIFSNILDDRENMSALVDAQSWCGTTLVDHHSALGTSLENENDAFANFEYEYRTETGRVHWFSIYSGVMEYSGERCCIAAFVDITSEKLLTAELKTEEQHYLELLDKAPSQTLVFDDEGKIRFVSSSLNELLGFEAPLVSGVSIFDFVYHEDHPQFKETLERAHTGVRIADFKFRCTNSDRQWLLLEAAGRDLREDPIIKGFILTLRDITEQENTSALLRRNRLELRAIVDASPSSICLIDHQGFIKRANRAFEQKWSVPLKEVIGRCAEEFVPAAQFNLTIKTIEEIRLTGEKRQFAFQQGTRWFETYASPVIEKDGAVNSFVIMTTDVTEKRSSELAIFESEARLQDIAEYATDWFWEIDETFQYSYLSETTISEFDGGIYPSIGCHILDIFDENHAHEGKVELAEILKAHQPFRNVQAAFMLKGAMCYVSLAGKPLYSEIGQFVGYRGTGKNITSEVQARRQANDVEKKLFQAQKMDAVGQLTGGIAHDFNNLLAIICGNIELLQEQLESDETLLSFAKNALTAAERGASLTQRLLAFSRKQVLVPKQVYLSELVENMQEIISRTLAEDIEIVTSLKSDVWPVTIDAAQMENSLLNLALNARDAMPVGGRLVFSLDNRIITDNEDIKTGKYVSLKVADTGTGIDENSLPYIFDPFFSTKAVGKGTGLGLSMVFGFVGQSNGYIFVDSELNMGSCFEILIPVSDHIIEATVEDSIPVTLDRCENCCILVVEDDEDVRSITRKQLESDAYRVLLAQDAKEAIAILNKEPDVKLLLTDLVLPGGKNGLELAKDACLIIPNIKILCMSGYLGDNSLNKKVGETNTHFIGKPYRRSDLLKMIRKILSDRKLVTDDTQM